MSSTSRPNHFTKSNASRIARGNAPMTLSRFFTRKNPATTTFRPSAATVPFAVVAPSHQNAQARRRKAMARLRPGLDMMEQRTMLSVAIPTAPVALPSGSAPTVQLAPMENNVVHGKIAPGSTTADVVHVELQQGEIFTASVQVGTQSSPQRSEITVSGPQNFVDRASTLNQLQIDPQSLQATSDSSVFFRAPTKGSYDVQVGAPSDANGVNYTLTMRPITLDTNTLDPNLNSSDASKVSFSGGGLYAWMSPDGQALDFSGPTGIGFQVGGTWTEQNTGGAWSSDTFTATNDLSVDFLGKQITLPLPSGTSFRVTTQPNGYGGLFGQVSKDEFQVAGVSLNSILSPLSSLGGLQNLSIGSGTLSVGPQVSFGINLGGDAHVQSTNLPVDAAVPYIYLSASTGLGLSFGQTQISAALSSHFGVVMDPSDASVGVDIEGPVPVVSNFAAEFSNQGLIPFTPTAAPEQLHSTLYGEVYLDTTIDISSIQPEIPVSLNGSMVMNFGPTLQTESSLSDWSNSVESLANGTMSNAEQQRFLQGLDFGLIGNMNLSFSPANLVQFSLPAFEGSLVVKNDTLYLHGDNVNPLSQTPLSFLAGGPTGSLDGMYNWSTDAFSFTGDVQLMMFGTQLGDAGVTINNTLIAVHGGIDPSISPSINVPNASASANASFNAYVDLSLYWSGTASYTVSYAASASASASFNGQSWNSGTAQASGYQSGIGNWQWAMDQFSRTVQDDYNKAESLVSSEVQEMAAWFAGVMHDAGQTWDQIVAALKQGFNEAETGAAYIIHNLGAGATDIANALKAEYGAVDSQVAAAMHNIGIGATDIANALKAAFGDMDFRAASVLSGLKIGAADIANALKGAYGDLDFQAASILHNIGDSVSQVAGAIENAFNENVTQTIATLNKVVSPDQIASWLRSASYDPLSISVLMRAAGMNQDQIATALKDDFNETDKAVAGMLQLSGFNATDIAGALKNAYSDSASTISSVLSQLDYDVTAVGNALNTVFTLTSFDLTTLLLDAGYAWEAVLGFIESL